MNIYFGEVNKQEAESWGGSFHEFKGRLFDFKLSYDFGSADLVVSDGIGRYVPFTSEDAIKLFKALRDLYPVLAAELEHQKRQEIFEVTSDYAI